MNVPSTKYVVVLAIAAVSILVVGTLVRPREPGPVQVLPSEAELNRLMYLAQRRSLENTSAFFASVADRVGGSIVTVPASGRTGVVWTADLAVTVPPEADEDGSLPPVLPVVTAPIADPSSVSAASRHPALPAPGDWLVAVWRTGGAQAYGGGALTTAAPVACGEVGGQELLLTFPLVAPMAGGGLFDVDGRLVAIVARCDGRYSALTLATVDAILQASATPARRLLTQFGLRVGALTPEEAVYFKTGEGLLVRDVWTGLPGDLCGLRPGDVILAIDKRPVADLRELLAEGADAAAVALTVQRARASLTLSLSRNCERPTAASAPPGARMGIRWAPPQPGFSIAAVVPKSTADLAGIRPGDRLLRIDLRVPASLADVERALARVSPDHPTFFEIARGGHRWGVLRF